MTAAVGLGAALVQMLLVGVLAGVGGTLAMGWAIAGAARTVAAREQQRRTAAVAHALTVVVAGAAALALVAATPLLLFR